MALHLVTGYAGREHVTSADHGSFNIAFVGAGEYVFDRGQKFAASIINNNTVDVADGDILMQGRHIRQIENHVTRLSFDSGERGFYRNDLIVAEYEKDSETFVESATLKVIKGTQTDNAENVTDPKYTHGDITEATGATLNQMPLYRVKFSGYELSAVEQLFEWLPSVQHILDKMWKDIGKIPTEAEEYFEREKARFTSEINAAEAQFLKNLDSTEVSNQQAFQTWFDTIKGILDKDTAGHLQGEIEALQSSLGVTNNNVSALQTGKENKLTIATATIATNQWSNGTYSFESTYPNATYDIEQIQPYGTADQLKAWGKAMIVGNPNGNTITCRGTVPSVNIPIMFYVRRK